MAVLTNAEIMQQIVSQYPNIINHSAEDTLSIITEQGFSRLSKFDSASFDTLYGLLLRVWLQQVNTSEAQDYWSSQDFGEYYDTPYGAYIQRLSIGSMKPVNPAYLNLTDGDWVNQDKIRKAKISERFFPMNLEYQNWVTIPDDFNYKQMFVSEYGISETMAAITQGLQNGYILQKNVVKNAVINDLINNTAIPLRRNQVFEMNNLVPGTSTEQDYALFMMTLYNIIGAMISAPQTGQFNRDNFKTVQHKERLRILVRPDILSAMQFLVRPFTYREDFGLGVKVIPAYTLGGEQAYEDASFTTPLYPVYDDDGEMIGYNTAQGATDVTVTEDDAYYKTANDNVLAVIADKGVIFESVQNPYEVEQHRNRRGRYTNIFASSPHNAINWDSSYNHVIIRAAAS